MKCGLFKCGLSARELSAEENLVLTKSKGLMLLWREIEVM